MTEHVTSPRPVLMSNFVTLIDTTADSKDLYAALLDWLRQLDALLMVIHRNPAVPGEIQQLAAAGTHIAEQCHGLVEFALPEVAAREAAEAEIEEQHP